MAFFFYISTSSAAAKRPAFIIKFSGIDSNVLLPKDIVRHSESPQTSQHLLFPVSPPIHSSRSLPLTNMIFDCSGLLANVVKSRDFCINSTSIPNAVSAFFSFETPVLTVSPVSLHRGQV